jgi:phosphohistidine phosphatase
MELYILRHGIAEEVSASGADRDRRLTDEGREKIKEEGKALRKLQISFDLILTSPFPRAAETAEIVAEELDLRKVRRESSALASGAGAESILGELRKVAKQFQSVLVVGHEPELSQLISLLLSGSPELAINVKKGALCKLSCVALEPGGARLEWLLAPKHLCRMA